MGTVCEQTHEEGGGGFVGVETGPGPGASVPGAPGVGVGRGGGIGAREGEREDKSNGGDSPRLTLFRNEDRM